eukprot:scaffold20469_cov75-Phaeocystis_antarctica.AAC.2
MLGSSDPGTNLIYLSPGKKNRVRCHPHTPVAGPHSCTATDEQCTIRVRTSDDQETLWSPKAVQRAGTLSDMHLHADSDGVLIVDRLAPAVCVVAAICESADESRCIPLPTSHLTSSRTPWKQHTTSRPT